MTSFRWTVVGFAVPLVAASSAIYLNLSKTLGFVLLAVAVFFANVVGYLEGIVEATRT